MYVEAKEYYKDPDIGLLDLWFLFLRQCEEFEALSFLKHIQGFGDVVARQFAIYALDKYETTPCGM